MPLKLTTYYRGNQIPDLPGSNTFHSTELFHIYEATPGYTPVLIVASEQDRPVAKLLAALRKVSVSFRLPSSNDARSTAPENTLIPSLIKKLSSATC